MWELPAWHVWAAVAAGPTVGEGRGEWRWRPLPLSGGGDGAFGGCLGLEHLWWDFRQVEILIFQGGTVLSAAAPMSPIQLHRRGGLGCLGGRAWASAPPAAAQAGCLSS